MRSFILLGLLIFPLDVSTGCLTPGYLLTDEEAGYDQAAYDACRDSAEDCEDL